MQSGAPRNRRTRLRVEELRPRALPAVLASAPVEATGDDAPGSAGDAPADEMSITSAPADGQAIGDDGPLLPDVMILASGVAIEDGTGVDTSVGPDGSSVMPPNPTICYFSGSLAAPAGDSPAEGDATSDIASSALDGDDTIVSPGDTLVGLPAISGEENGSGGMRPNGILYIPGMGPGGVSDGTDTAAGASDSGDTRPNGIMYMTGPGAGTPADDSSGDASGGKRPDGILYIPGAVRGGGDGELGSADSGAATDVVDLAVSGPVASGPVTGPLPAPTGPAVSPEAETPPVPVATTSAATASPVATQAFLALPPDAAPVRVAAPADLQTPAPTPSPRPVPDEARVEDDGQPAGESEATQVPAQESAETDPLELPLA